MKISVCIPMYNEGETCVRCADALVLSMDNICASHGWEWEALLCDDGSTDKSRKLLEQKAPTPRYGTLKVTGYKENRGKGAAVRHAVMQTAGDVVVYTDCDLAYGTDVIEKAALLVADGADMVLGSRNMDKSGYEGYSSARKFVSKAYIKLISVAAGFSLSDSQCGFKAFSGSAARKIFSVCTTNGFSFDLEVIKIAQKMGLRLIEMPVHIQNRDESRKSKVRVLRDSAKMIRDISRIKKHVKGLNI